MTNKNKFYVTTPIYYVTAKPHLGSLYSTLLADVAARWNKLRGKKVFFLTGTDEHGQKVAQASSKAGKMPQEFVDSFINDYKKMWQNYEINYDYFIRTTNESHIRAVQEWIKRLIEKGDIYKSFYTGFYCTPCETYVTEKDESVKGSEIPACVSCGRMTNQISEESYFFKLSAYQDKLLKFYEENPDFITPSERMNEVISFVQQGLRDLSVSRTTVSWGIPFPNEENHVTYVWADALNNYITAIGYSNPLKEKDFEFWWPADMQVLGKDILRFHAVYWPAFLMATGLEMPKKLLVHGWIKVNNQKMSKSFGNVIDPEQLLNIYGVESVRYYLTRYMAITQDSEFSTLDLEQKINSDLADDLGNLINRLVVLAHKKEVFEVKPPQNWGPHEITLRDSFWDILQYIKLDMKEGYFYRALNHLWKFINQVNAYFHSNEPWKISDKTRFSEIVSAVCHSLHSILILLWPVMPEKSEKLLKSIGYILEINDDKIKNLNENPWNRTFILSKITELFKKFDTKTETKEERKETKDKKDLNFQNNITVDEFSNVILLVGKITHCEDIKESEKLLKLVVDFGSFGTRQILSGIKKWYNPNDLIGKQAVFVYNLVPRKIMGFESHGMILTVSSNESLEIISPSKPVPNGTRLK